MKVFLTLASLVVFSVLSVSGSDPPLRVKFGSFEEMPKTATEAADDGWTLKDRPSGAPRESCEAYCSDSMFICMLYDKDNGFPCGMILNIAQDIVSGTVFDWETQGYMEWDTTYPNGTSVKMMSLAMSFVSEDYLSSDATERASSYNYDTILQEGYLWLSWFNGEEMKISNSTIEAVAQGFTKQNFIPLMGTHYYYNMSSTTECSSSTISPWFLLFNSDGYLVAVGYSIFGEIVTSTSYPHESPSESNVELIVTDAPDCYYAMAASPGVVTLHSYFISLVKILAMLTA